MQHSKSEADIAQGNAAADQETAACTVQNDFDVGEGEMAELHIKDRPENQVRESDSPCAQVLLRSPT